MKRILRCDTVVIGGGLAGLSTAWHLARAGERVAVLEQEKKLGGHASGRNAGMIRQAIADPVTARLAKSGRDSLALAEKKGWRIGFRVQGSLLLASGRQVDELETTARSLSRLGLSHRWLDRAGAARLVPALGNARYDKALYCPSDAIVDIEALLTEFAKRLRASGGLILTGAPVKSLRRAGGMFVIEAGGHRIHSMRVVNAAGAWAGIVARKAGASRIPMKAYRRHLFEGTLPADGFKHWPFVWDLSAKLYFRPLKRGLLFSPCDKDPFTLKERDSRGVEKVLPAQKIAMKRKLGRFSPSMKAAAFFKAKAGLRTMSSDGRFVIGEDPKVRGFFWVAGLGGHGVTTCFSVGRLAAELVAGKKPALAANLSPARFGKKRK